jgi:hypothetical protein
MTDHELAERLAEVVDAGHDDPIRRLIRAGEDVAAVLDAVEQAASEKAAVPRELLDAVGSFVDESRPGMDDVDVITLREDVATLAPLALTA